MSPKRKGLNIVLNQIKLNAVGGSSILRAQEAVDFVHHIAGSQAREYERNFRKAHVEKMKARRKAMSASASPTKTPAQKAQAIPMPPAPQTVSPPPQIEQPIIQFTYPVEKVHSVYGKDIACICSQLSILLKDVPLAAKYLPLAEENIFEKLSDGVLLCAMANIISPGSIDENAVVQSPTGHEAARNFNLALTSLQNQGICIDLGDMNLDGSVVQEFGTDMLVGILLQLLRLATVGRQNFRDNPNLALTCDNPTDQEELTVPGSMPREQMLVQWVNHQLKQKNPDLKVKDLSKESLSDCVVYANLIDTVAPKERRNSLLTIEEILGQKDLEKRAVMVVQNAKALDLGEAINPDIILGSSPALLAIEAPPARLAIGAPPERLAIGAPPERLAIGAPPERLAIGAPPERLAIEGSPNPPSPGASQIPIALPAPGASPDPQDPDSPADQSEEAIQTVQVSKWAHAVRKHVIAISFIALLAKKYPNIDTPSTKVETKAPKTDNRGASEETLMMWINSCGPCSPVQCLDYDLRSGITLLQVFDVISEGIVNWSKVNVNEVKMPKRKFVWMDNCSEVMECAKKLGIKVNCSAVDIASGQKINTLALVFVMMLKHSQLLRARAVGINSPEMTDASLVTWFNQKIKDLGAKFELKDIRDGILRTTNAIGFVTERLFNFHCNCRLCKEFRGPAGGNPQSSDPAVTPAWLFDSVSPLANPSEAERYSKITLLMMRQCGMAVFTTRLGPNNDVSVYRSILLQLNTQDDNNNK